MHNWEKAIIRFERLAHQVLQEYGYPVEFEELMEINPGDDRKIISAVLIVYGAYLLREFIEQKKIHRALDRFLAICEAYDDLMILSNVPSYENKTILTREYIKDLNVGVRRNKGGEKGRKNREPKATKEKCETELDRVYAKHKKLGITRIRKKAGENLGLSARQIQRITKYNPTKN